ncbi:phage head morphogenesis protein, partial [Streptococcus danieliae]|nr:phage head morphogenesis protein [Streptococcus danieliae]
NRERQVMDDWAKKDVELDKLLKEMYQEGTKRIQNRIDSFYMRYAQKEGLTLAEAKKAADMFDVKLWEQDAAKAVADKDFSPYANKWLRLYNLKMKVARDELLKRELELEITKLTNQVETQMNIARMDAAMKEFERQAGILGGSTGTPRRLKSVLDANFYGKSFSERVWGNGGLYHQTQKQVFKSISNSMTDMDGYKKERNR